jgi:hypothetical protein
MTDIATAKIVFSEEVTLELPGHLIPYNVRIWGNLHEVTKGTRQNPNSIFVCDFSKWQVFYFSNNSVNGAVCLCILEVLLMLVLEEEDPNYMLFE